MRVRRAVTRGGNRRVLEVGDDDDEDYGNDYGNDNCECFIMNKTNFIPNISNSSNYF